MHSEWASLFDLQTQSSKGYALSSACHFVCRRFGRCPRSRFSMFLGLARSCGPSSASFSRGILPKTSRPSKISPKSTKTTPFLSRYIAGNFDGLKFSPIWKTCGLGSSFQLLLSVWVVYVHVVCNPYLFYIMQICPWEWVVPWYSMTTPLPE